MGLLFTAFVLAAAVAACDGCGPDTPSGDPAPAAVTNALDRPPFGAGNGDWEWQTRGIGGGGAFVGAAINPHDPDDITISTDMGAVFRTTDFGRSWFALRFDVLRGSDFADPRWTSDPLTAYAIDARQWQGHHPVRTSDGGLTWDRLDPDPTGGQAWWIGVDPRRTDRILLANWSTLFASTDGGATFRPVWTEPVPEAGLYIAGTLFDRDEVWVATASKLLHSSDGGATFAASDYPGLPADQVVGSFTAAVERGTTRMWIVSRMAGQVWPGIRQNQTAPFRAVWTLDHRQGPDLSGEDFRELHPDLEDGFHPFAIAAANNDIDTVYLSGSRIDVERPEVMRSRDGGQTWERTFIVESNANIATGWCGHRGDLDFWWSNAPLTFAVSLDDSDRLVFGDFGFVHVSADGGTTWRQAYVHVADQNQAGSATPKGRAYRGVGLENTSAWWLHWQRRELESGPVETLFAAFSDIRGIVSADGGTSWRSGFAAGLPDNSTYHVVEGDDGRLYAATSEVHDLYQSTYLEDALLDPAGGRIVASGDGGLNWTVLHDLGHPVAWLARDPDAPGRLYASVVDSIEGGIYVTDAVDDPGAAWRRLPAPPRTEGHPYNIHLLEDGTLVTTWSGRRHQDRFTESSGVFVSTDGGATWQDRSHPGMRRWTKDLVIDPHDPTRSTWYVGVFSHWGSAPNELGGVYRTRDRGASWDRISDLYRVDSVAIDPEDPDRMYVTTEGAGLWQTRSLRNDEPVFVPVLTYPFEHPTRVFFDPFDREVWVTSFGGGLRVLQRD